MALLLILALFPALIYNIHLHILSLLRDGGEEAATRLKPLRWINTALILALTGFLLWLFTLS